MRVVGPHGFGQRSGRDAARRRKLLDGGTALQIAATNVLCQRKRKGLRKTEAISALKTMVADQPRRYLLAAWHRGHHGRCVIVVAIGFIDEALAIAQHTDYAWLATVD